MFVACASMLILTVFSYSLLLGMRILTIKRIVIEISKKKQMHKRMLQRCDQVVWNIVVDSLDLLVFILAAKFGVFVYKVQEKLSDACACACMLLLIFAWKRQVRFPCKLYFIWIHLSNCLCMIGGIFYILGCICFFAVSVWRYLQHRKDIKKSIVCFMVPLCTSFCARAMVKDSRHLFIKSMFMLNHKVAICSPGVYAGCIAAQSIYVQENILCAYDLFVAPDTYECASSETYLNDAYA